MQIDEKNFFHQATIRLCGSLQLDQALMQCFNYLKDFLPLDDMRVEMIQEDIGALRCLAFADSSGGMIKNSVTPLSEHFIKKVIKWYDPGKITIINDVENDPVAHKFVTLWRHPVSSFIAVPLHMENIRMIALSIRADGKNRYTTAHARLLSTLHDLFVISTRNALKHHTVLKMAAMLADQNQYLAEQQLPRNEIVGAESGLKTVIDKVLQVAGLETPVLLLGETGVGKELIANAIHYYSARKYGPYIKVNSGAIPESLVDSELFGHERGSFTGAVAQKKGRFERANGGTIFLDEIGDLGLQAQTKLLRVIQQKEIERVGGTETIPVDVRIIAATHRNLEHLVSANQFREDLWYRLNVFPINIPPLRLRKSDIPALTEHFLRKKSTEINLHTLPPLAPGAINRLMDYPWKGNVRELENIVERALIQYSDGLLSFDQFLVNHHEATIPHDTASQNQLLKLDEVIARHIHAALEKTQGKINGRGGAAELLGIHPSTLRFKMDRLGLQYGRKVTQDTSKSGS